MIESESVTEPGSTSGERLGKMFGLGEQVLEWLSDKSFLLFEKDADGNPIIGPDGKPGAVPFTKNEYNHPEAEFHRRYAGRRSNDPFRVLSSTYSTRPITVMPAEEQGSDCACDGE